MYYKQFVWENTQKEENNLYITNLFISSTRERWSTKVRTEKNVNVSIFSTYFEYKQYIEWVLKSAFNDNAKEGKMTNYGILLS